MIKDIPAFQLLKSRMRYLQARQKVLAANVANSDTPGFRPKDIEQAGIDPTARGGSNPRRAAAVQTSGPIALAVTSPAHLTSSENGVGGSEENGTRYETRPSGNSVSLEDEMMKVAQNQSDFQAAATLYQRSMNTLRLAIGRKV